jgi:TetR/AcrR family transcriptional repressor of nem operon
MAATEARSATSTSDRILDVAEQLVQSRGYNGFSYADIARELGITKASLHYHFASKAELGQALIERYAERFLAALDAIDAGSDRASAKLDSYAGLYADVLRRDRLCLCGMLAAEYLTLPQPMQTAVIAFFEENVGWLEGTLGDGRSDGTLHFDGAVEDVARALLGSLQGAMLIARPYEDLSRFQAAVEHTLGELRVR